MDESSGFVKTFRSIDKMWWYKTTDLKCVISHLILRANTIPRLFGDSVILRGQVAVGRRALSLQTGISQQRIRTILRKLSEEGEVSILPTKKFSIITILNYELYQGASSKILLSDEEKPKINPHKTKKSTRIKNKKSTRIKTDINIYASDSYSDVVEKINPHKNNEINPPILKKSTTTKKCLDINNITSIPTSKGSNSEEVYPEVNTNGLDTLKSRYTSNQKSLISQNREIEINEEEEIEYINKIFGSPKEYTQPTPNQTIEDLKLPEGEYYHLRKVI